MHDKNSRKARREEMDLYCYKVLILYMQWISSHLKINCNTLKMCTINPKATSKNMHACTHTHTKVAAKSQQKRFRVRSTITLNINDVYTPIKRQRWSD